jgi:hypothetical protein
MGVARRYCRMRKPQPKPAVAVVDARETVLDAAKRVGEGSVTPEIETLRLRLEKATGVPLAELASTRRRGQLPRRRPPGLA